MPYPRALGGNFRNHKTYQFDALQEGYNMPMLYGNRHEYG